MKENSKSKFRMIGDDDVVTNKNEKASTQDDYQEDYEEALLYLGKLTETFPMEDIIKGNEPPHLQSQNTTGTTGKESMKNLFGNLRGQNTKQQVD